MLREFKTFMWENKQKLYHKVKRRTLVENYLQVLEQKELKSRSV
jgi:hypothetical protein